MAVLHVSDDFKICHIAPERMQELIGKLRDFDIVSMREEANYFPILKAFTVTFDDHNRIYSPKLPRYRPSLTVSEEELEALQAYFKAQTGKQDKMLADRLDNFARRIFSERNYVRDDLNAQPVMSQKFG